MRFPAKWGFTFRVGFLTVVLGTTVFSALVRAEAPEGAASPVPENDTPSNEADSASGAADDERPVPTNEAPSPAAERGGAAVSEDEVVVTGSRAESRRLETPRSISTVTAEDIAERQAYTVPEALRESPGVHMQETNRGSGTPFLRGQSGPQNLILVDGVPFNLAIFRTGPNQYLATLDPLAVRRVEIVRGPSSVLYGNGAMGGVIQVLMEEPRLGRSAFDWNGKAQARFSSADLSPGAAARFEGGGENWGFLAGAGFLLAFPLRSGGGAEEPMSDYQSVGWRAKFTFAPAPAHTLRLSYLGFALLQSGRADELGRGDARRYDNFDHLVSFRHDFELTNDVLRRIRTLLWYRHVAEDIAIERCKVDSKGVVIDRDGCAKARDEAVRERRRLKDRVHAVGGSSEIRLLFIDGRLELLFGLEGAGEWVGSERRDAKPDAWEYAKQPRGNFSDDSTYGSLGLFQHARFIVAQFARNLRIQVAGGARLSHFRATAPDVPGLGKVEYDFTGAVASAEVQLVQADRNNLYLAFFQGFRAPNLQESTFLGFEGDKFLIPNPSLKPERSDTLEVGFKFDTGPGLVGARFAGAYYHSWIADILDEVNSTYQGASTADGKPVRQRVNQAKGVYDGVEAEFDFRAWRFTLSNHLTWTRGEVTNAAGKTTPARRVPPLFGRVGLRYDHPGPVFYAEAFVAWALRQDRLHPGDLSDQRICQTGPYSGTLANPCRGTPGYFTLNLRGGAWITSYLRLDAALSNITDEVWRTYGSGYSFAGIDGRISLTARF